jgi:Ankyrin repeats (many copies)
MDRERNNNGNSKMDTITAGNGSWEGHLNVVMWLHENRANNCITTAMAHAARNGHVDIVKWLYVNRFVKDNCSSNSPFPSPGQQAQYPST